MKHLHRYQRVNIAKKGNPEYWVMKCNLGGCQHYTPMRTKLSAPLLVGKTAICNHCQTPFDLNRRALQQSKPICNACVNSKEKKEVKKASSFFEELEKDLLK